jgi:murein DD-endopeptidase MepM/ murein hydrolase activator NlpD
MSKWETIKGSAGFFATMAVFLLAVGISGYFLLLGKEEEPLPVIVEEPAETTVSAMVEEVSEPVVEVLAPEPVQETPPPMPEIEVDDTPVIAEAPRLIVTPVHGEVLMAFSMEELTYNPTMEDWRTHSGIDIAAASGTTVLAACNGQVLAVVEDALMGTTVVLEHDGGYQTTYANLQVSPPVTAGDFVSAGQIIGAVGSTAAAESAQESHLHFAVTKDGESIDPHTFLDE